MLFALIDNPEVTWSGGGAIVSLVAIIWWLVRTYRDDLKEARNEFRNELAGFRASLKEITADHSKVMGEIGREMSAMAGSIENLASEVAEIKRDRGPNRGVPATM
jgi:hypothetical protein